MTNKKVSTSPNKKISLGGGDVCRKCGIVGVGRTNSREQFRKGPWTAEEDALLMEYVRNHGERHWNCVQKTGLMRCGKSCRLRWTNHLRPDLKKGAFAPEEGRIVLELHAQLGNRWSKIAAELPGRTDNEVKNFWNTKIKRKMRIQSLINTENPDSNNRHDASALHPGHQNNQQAQAQTDPPSIPSSPSLASLFSPTPFHVPSIDPSVLSSVPLHVPTPAADLMTSMQNDPIISFLNNPTYKFKYLLEGEEEEYYQSSGSTLPITSVHPSIPIPFQTMPSLPCGTLYNNLFTPQYGYSVVPVPDNMSLELPSNQIHTSVTPTSSSCQVVGYLQGKREEGEASFSMDSPIYGLDGPTNNSSGVAAVASASAGKELDCSTGHVQSFTEMRQALYAETMDDDLSSLLNNFSSIECPPEWDLTGNMLNSHSLHKEAAISSVSVTTVADPNSSTTRELGWTENAYCWNNMPEIH